MQITFKTINQEAFQIDVESADTVRMKVFFTGSWLVGGMRFVGNWRFNVLGYFIQP